MDNETLGRANMLHATIAECDYILNRLDKDPNFVNIDIYRCHSVFKRNAFITDEEIETAKNNLKELIRTRATIRREEAIKEFETI